MAEQDNASDDSTPGFYGILGLAALAAVAYGIYLLAVAVDPGHVAPGKNPGVFQLILTDRTTLTLVRLGVIAFVLYLGWSVFMLVRDGRPVTSMAGISVEQAAEVAQEAGEAAVGRVLALEQQLAEAIEDNQFLVGVVQQLQEALEERDDVADHGEDQGDEPDPRPLIPKL